MENRYLFKARGQCSKLWHYGVLTFCGDCTCHIKDNLYNEKICDTSTLCQCTGLKDKNGKLIWENDIVDFLGHKGTVVFECGSFGIAYKVPIDWNGIETNILPITGCENRLYACGNDNYISLWEIYWNFNDEDDSVNTVEAIGNIFDNPELLESEG